MCRECVEFPYDVEVAGGWLVRELPANGNESEDENEGRMEKPQDSDKERLASRGDGDE